MRLTEEQLIEKSIAAAYDSVNLINELKALKKITAEDQDTLDRNVEHIRIMMTFENFVSNLTEAQFAELSAI